MAENRPDARAVALSYLAPLMFGLHSLLLPWMSNTEDHDEAWAFWQLDDRPSLAATSVDTWALAVVLLGVVVAVVCAVRAGLPDQPRSFVAAGLALALAVCAAAIPFVMHARFAEYDTDAELVVRWGGPVTFVLAALWVAGTCLAGGRPDGVSRTGWARPRATGWSERGM